MARATDPTPDAAPALESQALSGYDEDVWFTGPTHSPPDDGGRKPTAPPPKPSDAATSVALAIREPGIPYTAELKTCQDALGDIEIHIYEAWTFEKITKDAARHFLVIADICGWDMPWVAEMREWAE